MENKTAIENLIRDPNLRKLESQFGGFNIFESIGAVRRELRHSDFLAFLLNPSENHQLFDRFIKPFLFCVAEISNDLSVIKVDLLNYNDVSIRREWHDIDILIVSHQSKFVCAIENKVDSTESDDQLKNYKTYVDANFSNKYTKVFAFLTKEGIDSSLREIWTPISYSDIYHVLKQIIEEDGEMLGDETLFAISQYAEVIQRHFMNNEELTKLCEDIYNKHKQALDLIFENRPDVQLEIKNDLEKMIDSKEFSESGIIKETSSKNSIRFAVKKWDVFDYQMSGDNQWAKDIDRVLLFEIVNLEKGIDLKFFIGPGDSRLRKKVFEFTTNKKIFNCRPKKLTNKWTQIFKYELVNQDSMDKETEKIKNICKQELERYLKSEHFTNLVNTVDKVFAELSNLTY